MENVRSLCIAMEKLWGNEFCHLKSVILGDSFYCCDVHRNNKNTHYDSLGERLNGSIFTDVRSIPVLVGPAPHFRALRLH